MSATMTVEQVLSAAREAVGRTSSTPLGTLDELSLQRFKVAVAGSIDGEVTDQTHPMYLSSILAWGAGPAEGELLPDGNAPDPFHGIDVTGLRLMHGGQQLEFHRDARAGMDVTMDVTLRSAELKESKSGQLLVLVVERRYSDGDGLLVTCSETFLGREGLA